MTALATEQALGRTLIDAELFDRLVVFLEHEEGLPRPVAERVMDQALAFLAMTAHRNDVPLSPSKRVDPGWHAFVLHTREYAAWCQQYAGRFIHHNPFKGRRLRDGVAITRTVQAIEDAGFVVDHELWGTAASCNPPTCCGDGPCC
ncbi:glycine-rich domain-containing protein [Streptomyces sp. SYSU K21746]